MSFGDTYIQLFNTSRSALKAVSPRLRVGGPARAGKPHGRQQFPRFESRFEHPCKKVVRRDLTPVRHNRRAKAHQRGRIVSRRIRIGDGATDRAPVPHLRVMSGRVGLDRVGILQFI